MTDPARVSRALVDLIVVSHTVTFEGLPGLVAEYSSAVGLRRVVFFAVDLQETVLREVTGHGPDAGAGGLELRVDGTLPGLAYQRVDLLPEPNTTPGEPGSRRWWVPMTDGVERLGVLRADTDGDDEGAREALRGLASTVALLMLSKRSFSDSYARLVRTAPMNVAAEMQWNLTPPPAYAGHNVTIGAVSEPAYEIGGDAFDYALAGSTMHLAVFDAMGHDATAGLTANVAVAACRNARRQGADPVETSRVVERTLMEQFGIHRYATGILAELDLDTGHLSWVNRGHPLPVLIRTGRWSKELRCPPAGPMGTDLGLPITLCHDQLEPGDRLALYTDGIIEARDRNGHRFGRDRFIEFILRHHSGRLGLHETLRRLIHAVMEHHAERLDDDATVLLAEWRGGHQGKLTP
ncbi:PP2C family protein-serine/threonine phosphatase [Streptomyces calidiresistens]|uniref:SpoIIE family protein phosphatase n=1 Tax=Streptomyces calidiresistens TaxID=1485586 RepID=A0A7W3SZ93_9ACTN|nr:SpoIIE family protein phosphatase [Streptomyces calidiresistens]MBB0228033.1 SpoIIE family protein phosphatase [Streptomyces calidiresistens]